MPEMAWVYLAPHLDDVSFSCGGLLWEQSQKGEKVEVWTIFAGDPPAGPLSPLAERLHESWGTGRKTPGLRRKEDELACAAIGAAARHFEFPDCIYRRHSETHEPLYTSSAAIFGTVQPIEMENFADEIAHAIAKDLPANATLVAPVTLGNHVDHQLVRAAAEKLGRELLLYADYPYILKNEHLLGYLLPSGSKGETYPVSEKGLEAWKKSVGSFTSQLSTYWPEPGSLNQAFDEYWGRLKGVQLWRSAAQNVN
jgi:LmbE family N-acetylglucosaminyl deacetylase